MDLAGGVKGDFLVQVEVRMMNLQSFKVLERLCGLCFWFSCSDWRMRRGVESWFFQMDLSPRSPEQGAMVCSVLRLCGRVISQVDCFQKFLTPCYRMCIVGSFPGCLTLESWIVGSCRLLERSKEKQEKHEASTQGDLVGGLHRWQDVDL